MKNMVLKVKFNLSLLINWSISLIKAIYNKMFNSIKFINDSIRFISYPKKNY